MFVCLKFFETSSKWY